MSTYIVTKEILNIRNRASMLDDHYIGSLRRGDTIELLDQTFSGDTPAGSTNNQWHPDGLNRCVSADGVILLATFAGKKLAFTTDVYNQAFLDPTNPDDQTKWKVSWGHIDTEIWKIWKTYGTRGENIRIAVIDTGVTATMNDLKGRISHQSLCVLPAKPLDDESPDGHGTMSAGLIGANGGTAQSVYGVAPKCELIVIKAGTAGFQTYNLVAAVQAALKTKPNIISMSLAAFDSSFEQDPQSLTLLKNLILSAKTDGPLFVAAAGDEGDDGIAYPASLEGAFSIVAYGLDAESNRLLLKGNNFNQFVKYACPGHELKSCSNTETTALFNDSSAATAFTAGLFALILSAVKRNVTYDQLLLAIRATGCAECIGDDQIPSNYQGFGAINPLRVIEYLISKS